MLTLEQLQENHAELAESIEAHKRDIIALDGAMQNCVYLMELSEAPVEEPSDEGEVSGGTEPE